MDTEILILTGICLITFTVSIIVLVVVILDIFDKQVEKSILEHERKTKEFEF